MYIDALESSIIELESSAIQFCIAYEPMAYGINELELEFNLRALQLNYRTLYLIEELSNWLNLC